MNENRRSYEMEEEEEATGTIGDALFCLSNHRDDVEGHPEQVSVNKGALDYLLSFLMVPTNDNEPAPIGWKELPLNSGDIIGEAYLRRIFSDKHGIPFSRLLNIMIETCPPRDDDEFAAEADHERQH